jgi:glycosyltransferase involved in cell wall biosynthesis
MALVTIGLPVYNGAAFLDAALASLSRQTFKDMEILISDNASTDETPDIISRWASQDSRIRYHRQPHNIGVVANFQWVLDNTQSRWFAYAAYDDLWSQNFVQSLYDAAMEKSDIRLSAPRMVTLFEDGREDRHIPFVESLRTASGLNRIRLGLATAHSGWYYGLFDRITFLDVIENSKSFKHIWSFDFVRLLPFIFAGTATGSDSAVYYKRQTPLSDERYRPKSAKDQFSLYRDFLAECLRKLNATNLSLPEKLSLLPDIIAFARHGGKPRRILRALIKELLK